MVKLFCIRAIAALYVNPSGVEIEQRLGDDPVRFAEAVEDAVAEDQQRRAPGSRARRRSRRAP